MFDICLLINLFISLIKIKNIHLKEFNKGTHSFISNLFIYLIEQEHPLKKNTHVNLK